MLFEPYTLGTLYLKNRIVMPPMTRSRAGAQSEHNAKALQVSLSKEDQESIRLFLQQL